MNAVHTVAVPQGAVSSYPSSYPSSSILASALPPEGSQPVSRRSPQALPAGVWHAAGLPLAEGSRCPPESPRSMRCCPVAAGPWARSPSCCSRSRMPICGDCSRRGWCWLWPGSPGRWCWCLRRARPVPPPLLLLAQHVPFASRHTAFGVKATRRTVAAITDANEPAGHQRLDIAHIFILEKQCAAREGAADNRALSKIVVVRQRV
jgi:hypothetical protein